MKKIVVFSLFITLVMILSGCRKPETQLLGTWTTNQTGETVRFTFTDDNTLNVNNEIWLQYTITKDQKIILGEESPVPYSIKNGILTIDQEDYTLILTRQK